MRIILAISAITMVAGGVYLSFPKPLNLELTGTVLALAGLECYRRLLKGD